MKKYFIHHYKGIGGLSLTTVIAEGKDERTVLEKFKNDNPSYQIESIKEVKKKA